MRDTSQKGQDQRRVWGVFGDGEMDEPESMSALTLAAREGLDNLVWVANCNLQRLDGPVRSNGRIIDELEQLFTGAGWNVIKLLWGSDWDGLFARDTQGALAATFARTVDGQFQAFAAKDGRYYIYDSMFGFQRVADLIWAAADQRARGFLLGATAGRTTLGGEGLQHQDGTSLLVASTVPNCRAYDPAFAGELAVIIDHGLREMAEAQHDVFFYITMMNENYAQPTLSASARDGVIKGLYRCDDSTTRGAVRLLGTDGFGRSDMRAALRSFFEVDRHQIVLAALTALAAGGGIDAGLCARAITRYGLAADADAPWNV